MPLTWQIFTVPCCIPTFLLRWSNCCWGCLWLVNQFVSLTGAWPWRTWRTAGTEASLVSTPSSRKTDTRWPMTRAGGCAQTSNSTRSVRKRGGVYVCVVLVVGSACNLTLEVSMKEEGLGWWSFFSSLSHSVFPLMNIRKEVGVMYSFMCLHFLFGLKRVKERSKHLWILQWHLLIKLALLVALLSSTRKSKICALCLFRNRRIHILSEQ